MAQAAPALAAENKSVEYAIQIHYPPSPPQALGFDSSNSMQCIYAVRLDGRTQDGYSIEGNLISFC